MRKHVAAGLFLALLTPSMGQSQSRQAPGHSIGAVRTEGNLIVLTLNEGALGKANLFDLGHRTLRFNPSGAGYRVSNKPIEWDPEFGAELNEPTATLKKFAFPFSGKTWESIHIGATGYLGFGGPVNVGRFDQLQLAARNLVNGTPAICVFMKPRMSGHRYVKELDDRFVITWDATEPYGGIQDFTWTPTVNRFQAVLHRDGTIDFSYDQLTARDAIVGVYPAISGGEERTLDTLEGEEHPAVQAHLNIRKLRLSVVNGLFLKAVLEMRGPVLPAADPQTAGVEYRVTLGSGKDAPAWAVHSITRGGRGGGAARYFASGPGVLPMVTVEGNTLSMQGTLPPALHKTREVSVYASTLTPAPADKLLARTVAFQGIVAPEVHLSSLKEEDGPFPAVYESFHYLNLPNHRDLTCSVIQGLGDKFDMLAYYSDFRVDNQEAGTPSNGPLGSTGDPVTGIGAIQRGLDTYCSKGRFQWQFIQPVYVGSNQMQERPPAGLTGANTRNVTAYDHQLGERSPDGHMLPYNYAMSQIGHEMGHRWSAFVSAKVNGETIPLGPTHWARGLQAPAAFPYQRPTEASAMGGGVWQDNFDGTFTQLDDDYYVPATSWSYLDLYLMGLIEASEVPDFFILRNLVPAGRDPNGHPIFKADRIKVTIADVIAAEGPRLPTVDQSQKKFNTGMVVVVEHGKTPSRELLERTNGIARQWVDYWATTTGHRASMTTNPR